MAKMSTSELQAILEAEKSDALSGMESAELSKQRSKAMEYYLGDVNLDGDMPPPPDRSQAVSSDVADTVEGLMPSLIEIFASGDDVAAFEPVGQEDEDAAQQETDYINHVFWHRNPGFLVMYNFLKDALIQKNGIVKVWWEETEDEEEETYTDIPDDAVALLAQAESVEVKEDIVSDEGLHTVTIVKRRKYGCCRVEPVPPEEFGITRRARSVHISQADYVFHETTKTHSDLVAQGYDPEQLKGVSSETSDTEESITRETVDDNETIGTSSLNDATRSIKITEHYVKIDYAGDGKARLYKVATADNKVLRRRKDEDSAYKDDIEPVDLIPFAAATPIIMPHRFFGRSVADLVMDIMRIKTALLRGGLDGIYLANNQRIEISESHAGPKTLDDLLTNRPGGIVRTKAPGGLHPLPNTDISGMVYPMLEYQDAVREWRTGVTRQGQGIDAKSLADQSATASAQMFTMAQARMRLIARIFAETGVRDMFLLMHATIRKHGRSQVDTIRLRNKWVPVDPREWKTRNDMTINVGISAGSKAQETMFLMNLLQIQREAIMAPQLGLVEPSNIYATLKRLIASSNLKSIEPYFTDPDEQDEQGGFKNRKPPPPDPKQAEIEGKMQLAQADMAIQQEKTNGQLQTEREKAAAQIDNDRQKAGAELQLQREKMMLEATLKREQMAGEFALKREQLAAELQLKRDLSMLEIAAKKETGMYAADAKASTSGVHMGGEPG